MVEHQRRVLRTHERIAKTLGVVSCSFLFCWLPFFSLYLTNYQCKGCVPTIAIDIASWLGYCNSMINPIIYSFTVKDFKRSALRLILPIWQFVFHCLPVKILPKPPDRIARVSRSGQKAKNRRNNNLLDGRTRACRNAYGGAANGKSRQLISETTYNKTVPTILPETVDHDRQSSNSSDNDELINIASVDDFNDPSILTDPTTTTSDTFCATKNFRWAKRKRNSSCKEPLTITTNHMNTTRSTPTKLSEWLDKTRKSRKNAEDSPLAKTDDSSLTNSFHSVKLATKMKKRWAFGQKRCSQSMDQPDDESLDTPDIEDMKKSLNLIESRRGTLLNDEGLTITQIRRGTLNKSTTIDCSGLSSDSTETPLLSYRQIECRGAAHVIRESITRKIEQYHNSSHDEQIEDPGATKTTRSDDDHPEDPCTPRPIRYRTYRHRDSQPQHSTGEVKSEDKLTANTGCNTSKGSVESVRIYLLTEEENV
ncbi:unnamed protein product [Bursaphelenchus xylophilus]|nr:unnamed protein product [Bursaphelenchus xylophilus]CAG9080473.1 unnamed protein product [Bursaphelenchus xylophilus]